MNERTMAALIQSLLESIQNHELEMTVADLLEMAGGLQSNGDFLDIKRVASFEEACVMTSDQGVLVTLTEGEKLHIIVK